MSAAEITRLAMEGGAAQKAAELEQFVELLLTRRLRTVLEIGTMQGGTLRAWCECATDDAVIVSVDLPQGPWGGGYDGHREATIRTFAKEGQTLHLLKGSSRDPQMLSEVVHALDGRELDLLFIDADHSYEGVKADFNTFYPLVRSGGLIGLHDISDHPLEQTVQVRPFWLELAAEYPQAWEFTVAGDERSWGPWGGIGAVQKP